MGRVSNFCEIKSFDDSALEISESLYPQNLTIIDSSHTQGSIVIAVI